MSLSAFALRQNVDKILDRVLETGIPVEIERKRGRVKIVPVKKTKKNDNLKKHAVMKCAPEELIHIDWSKEWHP